MKSLVRFEIYAIIFFLKSNTSVLIPNRITGHCTGWVRKGWKTSDGRGTEF